MDPRAPYLAQATPQTPPGWYTVPDGRQLWWSGMEWVVVPPQVAGMVPVPQQPTKPFRMVTTTPTMRVGKVWPHLVAVVLTLGLWLPFWLFWVLLKSRAVKKSYTTIE